MPVVTSTEHIGVRVWAERSIAGVVTVAQPFVESAVDQKEA